MNKLKEKKNISGIKKSARKQTFLATSKQHLLKAVKTQEKQEYMKADKKEPDVDVNALDRFKKKSNNRNMK